MELLRQAVDRVLQAGFAVSNLDCTIVAERPPLAPHIQAMRANLAAALDIALDCCNVKAKHTEGMGYTGEGIGMAAYAVALLTP